MYLDYQEHNSGVYVIDTETDGLFPSIIWVMCWMNALTGEKGECRGHQEIVKFFKETQGSLYVGHNILKYDGPVLARLVGVDIGVHNCIDTLVLSTLYSPSLDGGHSLDSWGERLGKPKIEFNDWSQLTEEMVTYCHQDVAITCELFRRLVKTLNRIGFSERSVWIQHHITCILEQQRKNGFYFDGPRAIELYQHLRKRENELGEEIHRVFPPIRTHIADRRMFTKSGSPSQIYLKDRERYIVFEDAQSGTYQAYEDIPFNIGSPLQRVEKLTALGWVPEEFTEKTKKGGGGNPKPFDKGELSPSLSRFLEEQDVPEVEMIARWMSINGRANMINTWIDNWNEDTHCIHGKLFVADTLRFRHQAPNTANIPAVRATKDGQTLFGEDGYYTYESRDLWTARPGRTLVGTDAAGLELRMLAHFLKRPAFTEQVLDGDPHQYNADMVGVSRPTAKTLLYATMYGAAAPKVARTLGVSVKEGAAIRNAFLDRLGLKDLMDQCQAEQSNGRIDLVDGSKIACPSPHAALNYKLQGSGARVMALGACILNLHISKLKLDSLKVGDIHDEWQYDVSNEHADLHADVSIKSIRDAGTRLKMNIPLDGTAKKGLTWAETH